MKTNLVAILAFSVSFASMAASSDTVGRVSTIRVPGASKIVKAETDASGAIHLVFDDGPRYVKSEDGGRTFGRPISIIDAAAQKPGLKFSAWDMAVSRDGRVHVAMGNNAWKLKLPQEEWALYYATLAPGAKAFSPVRNLNRKPSEGFSLAAGDRGAVTASFLSGKLFATTSRDNGETFTASKEINPTWNPCDCCTTSTAYGADGKLALLYREETNNDRDIYLILWDQSSDATTMRKRISKTPWKTPSCPMTYFTIAPTATGYVAVWPTKSPISFARLDKEGAVLAPGEIRTPGTSGMRTGVLGLGASDGATLVAWKNKDALGWQLYDAKAQVQGESGSVSSIGNGAAGVVLADGKFLLFP